MHVDYLIVLCPGCQTERRIEFDPPMVGAEAFVEWQKAWCSKDENRCSCGWPTCDMKLHVMPLQ